MKRAWIAGVIVLSLMGTAEAGFGNVVGRTWNYLFEPVNSITQFVSDVGVCVLTATGRLVRTVISNANPERLIVPPPTE